MAGSPVQTPCPASRCLEITVTVLSGAMRRNGIASGPDAAPTALPAPPGPVPHPGSRMPRVSPEPASVVTLRNCRRVSSEAATAAGAAASSTWRKYMVHSSLTRGGGAGGQGFGRLMDGAADAHVGGAPADVAR